MDDASTDSSFDIVKNKFSHLNNFNLLKNAINSGAAVAKNRGLKYACGEYVTFIDSDDFILQGYLEKLLDAARSSNADVVNSGHKKLILNADNQWQENTELNITTKKSFLSPDVKIRLQGMCRKNLIANACGKLYKHNFLKKHNLFFEPLIIDDVFFHFLVLYYVETYALIPDNLYCYRTNPYSINNDRNIEKSKKMLQEVIHITSLLTKTLQAMPKIKDDVILCDSIFQFFMSIYLDHAFVKFCNNNDIYRLIKNIDEVLLTEFDDKYPFVKYLLNSHLKKRFFIKRKN